MEVTNRTTHHNVNLEDTRNSHTDSEVETDLHQGDKMSPDNSDYDSADSTYSDDKNVKIRSRASDEHSETGSLTLEREEGDGQESVPSKKVDDDEDKKNPQYIPKRGTFYEHDDRTAEDDEPNVVVEEEKDKDGKKKVWQDKKERWSHDRFNEQEQCPKSRTELIGIYGYDIRNEDGPPRARRRRRYGRGPNKYTRNWEDEDAYNKPPPAVHRPKKPPRSTQDSEEFPPLVSEGEPTPDLSREQETSEHKDQPAQVIRAEEKRTEPPKEKPVPHVPQSQQPTERVQPHKKNVPEQPNNKNLPPQRIGSGRVVKPTAVNGFTSRTADSRRYNVKQEQNPGSSPKGGDFIKSQNFTNTKNLQELEKEMNKLSVDGVYKGSGNKKQPDNNYRHGSAPPSNYNQRQGASNNSNSQRHDGAPQNNNQRQGSAPPTSNNNNQRQGSAPPTSNNNNQRQGSAPPTSNNNNQRQGSAPPTSNNNNQRQGSVPPRMQSDQKGSKRYSSMRQRSLPEANNPPLQPNYHNPPSFYPNDYNQQPPPAVNPPPLLHQNAQMLPTPSQVPQIPPPPLQQPPAASLMQAPYAHPFPQPPPAFLQPGVAAPPFIPPPAPQIINYVQSQPPFPPNFQSYPQQFNPVTQPTELYQPQGGITYYSTDQQLAQRQAPMRRPKAAIPIVAPPGQEMKGGFQPNEGSIDSREMNETVEMQQ